MYKTKTIKCNDVQLEVLLQVVADAAAVVVGVVILNFGLDDVNVWVGVAAGLRVKWFWKLALVIGFLSLPLLLLLLLLILLLLETQKQDSFAHSLHANDAAVTTVGCCDGDVSAVDSFDFADTFACGK